MKKVHLLFTFFVFITLENSKAQNAWTQKADFPSIARNQAVGFSIGDKGYIGLGYPVNLKDFWQYDPVTNVWTQKADFGGTGRQGATGFSIGSKGYVGMGIDASSYRNDFWEYDPIANSWTQKANFGGGGRWLAIGFSINSKGYCGLGNFPQALVLEVRVT